MRASVIVPAYNCARLLPATLEAIAAQDVAPHEVIVVDDGSTDGTAEAARSSAVEVTVIEGDHAGPAVARNRGVARASGEALAFTDADCVPQRSWLREGLRALEHADLVQGAVLPDPAVAIGPFDRVVSVGADSALYETANLLVRRELFDAIGGFEDPLGARLGKPLGEDVLFGWRARRRGARVTFDREAVVHHAVFQRGALAYIAERGRLVYFPALAAKLPELRRERLFARGFQTRRSAAFDLALAGAAVSLVSGSPLPSMAALPYAAAVVRRARAWPARAPLVAAVDLAADAVGFAALALGSARSRSPVL